jgi:uncharacterized protein YciI
MKRLTLRLLLGCALALPVAAQQFEPYYVVFLRPAPDRKPLAKEEGQRIQSAHMANIQDMAKRGVLVAAGPFGDTPATISGLFVFKVGSMEEAQRIASADATVVEHRNTVEVYKWQGSKGIGEEYRRLHAADPKTTDDMGVYQVLILRRGPAWGRRAEFTAAHREHVERLGREGRLAAGGTFEGESDIAGLVIFQRMPEADARRLADEDPFVKAGVVEIEQHRWWCAAHVLPGR